MCRLEDIRRMLKKKNENGQACGPKDVTDM